MASPKTDSSRRNRFAVLARLVVGWALLGLALIAIVALLVLGKRVLFYDQVDDPSRVASAGLGRLARIHKPLQ